MLKFNQNLLLNEAWQDLGMHNKSLVTVVEAVAWAQYKKYDKELLVQKVDYENWSYVDISNTSLDYDILTILDESKVPYELGEHHIRIGQKK